MVTRIQIEKIGRQLDALAEIVDPDAGQVTVAVFRGESTAFAARRHCELRPEHAGRLVRFDHRSEARDEWREHFAVHAGATAADFQRFEEEIRDMWAAEQQRSVGRSFVGLMDEDCG